MEELQIGGVKVCGSGSKGELQYGVVMVLESGDVCELLCGSVQELGFVGAPVCGRWDVRELVGELWCGSVVVRGNRGVCELRRVAAAVCRSYS